MMIGASGSGGQDSVSGHQSGRSSSETELSLSLEPQSLELQSLDEPGGDA